jgi:hypothetical protein
MKACLVIEDSNVIRKVARRILEGLEFEIAQAENGEEAVEACRKLMPEGILLDWNCRKFLARAASASKERQAGGHVLHHGKTMSLASPTPCTPATRVHHEARSITILSRRSFRKSGCSKHFRVASGRHVGDSPSFMAVNGLHGLYARSPPLPRTSMSHGQKAECAPRRGEDGR